MEERLQKLIASAGVCSRRAAEALMRQSTLYYTCHCTGKAPFDFLKGYMGDKLHYLPAGESVTL